MEVAWLYPLLTLLLFLLVFKLTLMRRSTRHRNLPPSPRALPIVGHLHLLKDPLHRTLRTISQSCGPIFSLRLGTRFVVVVSSPSAVEECFTENDVVFANRPFFISGKYLGYDYSTVVTAPYGDHWRNLRRIGALDIFSPNRMNMYLGVRRDEVKLMVRKLGRSTAHDDQFAKCELKSVFTEMTFNVIMRTVAGKRYYGEDVESAESREVREIIGEITELAGASNPADFLPVLRWFDYQGLEKRMARIYGKMDLFLQGLIDEHRNIQRGLEDKNSMIDHLLSLQQSEPEYYTDMIIKGLILIMILAGTDTTAVTIEWATALLLNHREVMQKVGEELDDCIGQDRLVDESDLPRLGYLQNVISESHRLFPAAPLLIPHMSADDCTVGGYDVPRGTMLFVNAWAIHRDPKLWEDPTSFKPERFEGGESGPYRLMPFGVGRRSCPGAGLSRRIVGLCLASLIQCFEWKRISEKEVDLAEGKGITMPKAEPLEAMCKARPIMKWVNAETTPQST